MIEDSQLCCIIKEQNVADFYTKLLQNLLNISANAKIVEAILNDD